MSLKEEISTIRKAIKNRCKTLSVRMGKGTAYGWIEISGSLEFGNFSEAEKIMLRALCLNFGGNFAVISPDDKTTRARLIAMA